MAKSSEKEVKTTQTVSPQGNSMVGPLLLLLVAVVFAWFSITSAWITRTIFNQQVFVSTVTAALQTPESRQAISESVVNRVLADYPIIRRAVGPTLVNTVSGVLASPQFQPVYEKAAQQVFIQMTTANPQEVSLDIKSATDFAAPIIDRLDPQLGARLANVPDKIVIIGKGEIPSIYDFGAKISFWGPVLGLVSIIIFGFLMWKAKGMEMRVKLVVWTAVYFAAIAFLIYFLIPSLEMRVMAQISNQAAVTVISQLFETMTASFIQMVMWIFYVSIAIIIGGFAFLKLAPRRG